MKLQRLVKSGLLISLVGLVLLALIVWFALPYFGIAENRQPRLLIIVSIVLVWALIVLYRTVRAHRANNAIADGLVAQEDLPGSHNQVDEERQVIAERFEQAIAVLKQKGVGGKSLYDLPWYIMIGPPGSGKTTALRNAELDFPLDAHFGNAESVQGIGGTRNCDWLFTNDAIFLDTAGRFVTQDSDREVDKAAWQQFLELLKKNRSRRPVNGVLLAIGLDELLHASEIDLEQLIKTVRLRLQELSTTFNATLPVYLLVTKCDLAAGFNEFFADLSREQRAQVFGMTFPAEDEPVENAAGLFEQEFRLILQRLDGMRLARMQQETDQQRRGLIFGYPRQFQAFRNSLERLLDRVFSVNRFEKPLQLRGVYFTSGTQEGTPIDRVIGSMSRGFGLEQQSVVMGSGKGKSFFLSSLLKDVIFREAGLSGVNLRMERRRAWLQRGVYAFVALLVVVLGVGWTTSYFSNSQYVQDVGAKLASFEGVAGKVDMDEVQRYEQILPMLEEASAIESTARQHQDDVPLTMGLGLYQGGALSDFSADAYQRVLNALLLPMIARDLEKVLSKSSNDWELDYETLKTYIMLGNTKRLDASHMQQWMALTWRQSLGESPELQEQLLLHLDALLERGLVPISLSSDLVSNVRQRLSQRSVVEFAYARLKRDSQAANPSGWLLGGALDPSAQRVFVSPPELGINQAIPFLFTQQGYYQALQQDIPNLVKEMSGESWVLNPNQGPLGRLQQNSLKDDVLELYADEYILTWRSLLENIELADVGTLSSAGQVLGLLSSVQSPLRELLTKIEQNTSLTKLAVPSQTKGAQDALDAGAAVLEKKSSGRLDRLLQSAGKSQKSDELAPDERVETAFEPLNSVVRKGESGTAPLDSIITLLSSLNLHVQSMDGGVGSVDALNELTRGGEGRALIAQLQGIASRQPPPLRGWLESIAKGGRAVTVKGAKSQLKSLVKGDVTRECVQLVNGRYPFFPGSQQDVTWEDFGLLFGHGGIMDRFFNDTLKPLVDTTKSRWQWLGKGDTSLGLSSASLRQFQRARKIRDIFFKNGGADPSLAFSVKPLYLDNNVVRFTLNIDGNSSSYQHGPARYVNVKWPGTKGTGEVRLVFEDKNGTGSAINKSGPWAWFRVLDEANLSKEGAGKVVATFTAGGHTAKYEIRASSVRNPFSSAEFRRFRCPGAP